MTHDLSSRAEAAFALLIAELFLRDSKISEEDRRLATSGIDVGWAWVEGQKVDSWAICNYIDGEINLPYRSTIYEEHTIEHHAMFAASLSIGIAANYCCQETNEAPSESVENFGDNEFDSLLDMIDMLEPKKQEQIVRVGEHLIARTASEAGQFGKPIARSSLTSV